MLQIMSWNVNGIRSVLRKGFLDWLSVAQPDILCLQEVRALEADLDQSVLSPDGYSVYWHPAKKKGYSGVATFSKTPPVAVGVLGVDDFDVEGRAQVVEFEEFTIINAYFPNSQAEGARMDYKVGFFDTIIEFCNSLRDKGKNVVLLGDYNVAHKAIDLARPKENEGNPGYTPEERDCMDRFVDAGYVDTFRHFNEEPGNYTWWSYRAAARRRNIGWRLDYHCVNEEFMTNVGEAVIHRDVMGSDHCPVSITLDV